MTLGLCLSRIPESMIVAPGAEFALIGLASCCKGPERMFATMRLNGPRFFMYTESNPLLAKHLIDLWSLFVRMFFVATLTAVKLISLATGLIFQSLAPAIAKIPAPHPRSSIRMLFAGLFSELRASRQPFVVA